MAQLCHAAGETGPAEPGCYAVVLAAESQRELSRLADRLDALEVPVHRVVESHGRYAGQLMAIGIPPGPKSIRGWHLSSLPLVRFRSFAQYNDLAQTHQAETERLSTENLRLRRELTGYRHARRPWYQRWFSRGAGR